MKQKRTRNRIALPNGNNCSTPSIHPKNWKTCGKKALELDWYILYYFYPSTGKRKQVFVRGMNEFKTLQDRRLATKSIYDDELQALKDGYNPILKEYVDEKPAGTLHGGLFIMDAFRLAFKKLEASNKYLEQIEYAINRIEKPINRLKFRNIKIRDFRRSQLKECFDFLKLPNTVYNKYIAYFSRIYRVLIEHECVETNITRDIYKKSIVKKQREVMKFEKVMKILIWLKENDFYEFYRYAMIFFYSGGRSAELLRVQAKHVDLANQEYKVLIQKRKQYVWETKIIIQSAIPFWTEIMAMVKSKNDFIFSYGLVPGKKPNDPHQITRRWRLRVKNKLCFVNNKVELIGEKKENEYTPITADFYSLKHTFLDYLDEQNALVLKEKGTIIDMAQHLASHTTGTITHSVYTINKKKRENEMLKQISV